MKNALKLILALQLLVAGMNLFADEAKVGESASSQVACSSINNSHVQEGPQPASVGESASSTNAAGSR